MPQMNHFCAGGLQNSAHNVDRGVMAVKQTGGGNDADGLGSFLHIRRGIGISVQE